MRSVGLVACLVIWVLVVSGYGGPAPDPGASPTAVVPPPPPGALVAPASADEAGTSPLVPVPAGPIEVPGGNASIRLPFRLQVDGTVWAGHEAWRLTDVQVVDNQGVLLIEGRTVPVLAYERIPWWSQDWVLYQLIGVEEDRWHVLWLYCDAQGSLGVVWHMDTAGAPLASRWADGACTESLSPVDVTYTFPDTRMLVPDVVPGHLIIGRDIYYDGTGPGVVRLHGRLHGLAPFEVVDCSGCGGIGWHELHALAWDPEARTASFLILYRSPLAPGIVSVSHAIELPTFERFGTAYLAAWVPAP